MIALPKSMHPAYAETHFAVEVPLTDSPAEFAIITAFATTGEAWTDAENRAADEALETLLRAQTHWLNRITGYSPTTGHAERGWAAELFFEQACEIGLRFKQDAIYFVRNGTLFVSHCDQRKALIELAPFLSRWHLSPGGPSFVGGKPR